MEYDSFLSNAKNSLTGISYSSFSSFISNSENANSNLKSFLTNFGSNLKTETVWKDDVQNKYISTISACDQKIKSIESFPKKIGIVANQIENYVGQITKYMECVDNYNTLEKKLSDHFRLKPSKESFSDEESYNSAYKMWSSGIESHRNSFNESYNSVKSIYEECYSLFNKINAALGSSEEAMIAYDFSGKPLIPVPKSEKLPDGTSKEITEYYDENGILVESSYEIIDNSGKRIEITDIEYYDNGKIKKTTTEKEYTNGVKTIGDIVNYDLDGNIVSHRINNIYYSNGDIESFVELEHDKDGKIISKKVGNLQLSDPVMNESVLRLKEMGCTNIQIVREDEFQYYMHEYEINSKDKDDYQYWKTVYKTDPETGLEIYDKTEIVSVEEAKTLGIETHDCSVLTFEKDINGISFNYISVYDKEMDEAHHERFDQRVGSLIDDISCIPQEMVNEIVTKNKTYIKFNETPEVSDAGSIVVHNDGQINLDYSFGGCSGITESGNNLVQANYSESFDDDYYSGMLLHELGHAYDDYSDVDGSRWLDITKNEVNPFLKVFAPEHELFDWDQLSNEEKSSLIGENFANCFREYCRSPELLKSNCPESYKAMNELYNNSSANYGRKKYKAEE